MRTFLVLRMYNSFDLWWIDIFAKFKLWYFSHGKKFSWPLLFFHFCLQYFKKYPQSWRFFLVELPLAWKIVEMWHILLIPSPYYICQCFNLIQVTYMTLDSKWLFPWILNGSTWWLPFFTGFCVWTFKLVSMLNSSSNPRQQMLVHLLGPIQYILSETLGYLRGTHSSVNQNDDSVKTCTE